MLERTYDMFARIPQLGWVPSGKGPVLMNAALNSPEGIGRR